MQRHRAPRPRFSARPRHQRPLSQNQYQHQGGRQRNPNNLPPPAYLNKSVHRQDNPNAPNFQSRVNIQQANSDISNNPYQNQQVHNFSNPNPPPNQQFTNFNESNMAPRMTASHNFNQNRDQIQCPRSDFLGHVGENAGVFGNNQSSQSQHGGGIPLLESNQYPAFPNQPIMKNEHSNTNMVNSANTNMMGGNFVKQESSYTTSLANQTQQMQIPGLDTLTGNQLDQSRPNEPVYETQTSHFQQSQSAFNHDVMGFPPSCPVQEQNFKVSPMGMQQPPPSIPPPGFGAQQNIRQPISNQTFTGVPPSRLPQPPNIFRPQHGQTPQQSFSSGNLMTRPPIQQQNVQQHFQQSKWKGNSNPAPFPENSFSQMPHEVLDGNTSFAKSSIPGQEKDAQWVHEWLLRKGVNKDHQDNSVPVKTKVCGVQEKIQRMMILMASLQKQIRLLSQCDQSQFDEELKVASNFKEEMETIRKYLSAVEVQELEKKVSKRRQKRERLKRQRQEKYHDKQRELERREELHKEIDRRLNKVYKEADDKRQQVELKKTADKILSEVRKKTQDVTRATDLLKNLKKLRKLRKDRLLQQGVHSKEELDADFEDKLHDCLDVLSKQKEVYSAEDKALRVMLETEQEENQEKEKEKRKQMLHNQEMKRKKKENRLLFGNTEPCDMHDPMFVFQQYYDQANQSLDSMIQIRCDWDRFCVPENTPGGSRIPDGFVIPEKPSSDGWATALKDDT